MTKRKVLVVDNNPVILRIVANVLEKAGCLVQTAGDGLAALDLLPEFYPDIIFTDLVMPKIDGAKLSYILRNTPAYKDIFLVVLSAIALEDDMNVLELGADVCIAKGPAATMKEHILAALHRFESGKRGSINIEGMQGLYPRDLTSELLVDKRHNEIVFERMIEGAFELDGQGRIIRANPVFCRLFERPEAEILSSRFIDLLPDNACRTFLDWMKGLSCSVDNQPLLFDSVTPVFLHGRQVTFNLVPVFEEEQFYIIGILQDVTTSKLMEEQQRRMERELEKTRKFNAMVAMAGGISHDVNNLLTIINGNVETARGISKGEEIDKLLSEASKALQLTAGLIRQFNTFSDNYPPSKSRVCVDKLLTELLEHELAGTAVEFQLTVDEQLSSADLDPDLMILVFRNILLNAVEAMNGKGILTVNLTDVDGEGESGRTGQPIATGKYIQVSISDTGSGIDQQVIDQVFDPYFSTKQKGTQKGMGLGLTIAHAIVEKHGGVVRLDSAPGGGSTARIYLPVDQD